MRRNHNGIHPQRSQQTTIQPRSRTTIHRTAYPSPYPGSEGGEEEQNEAAVEGTGGGVPGV